MITRIQIQSIVNLLNGQRATDPPTTEPWATIYKRLIHYVGMDPKDALWDALRGIENANAIQNLLLSALEGQSAEPAFLSLARLAEELQPVDWLWPDWIPRGMLSLLGASPGAGKSLVGLDLARRIIHRCQWPDGQYIAGTDTAVVYVDAEAVPQIQNARAKAWNMDRERLYLMLPPEDYGMLDFGSEEHQDQLITMCHVLRPALIVVDSLSSISVRGENNVEDVRAVLGFLSAVARHYDTGLLLIHHLRKRSRTPLMDLVTADDFRGSSHIIAMARSVLALSIIQDSAEPNRNGPRRMEIVKTNLCQYPPPLGLAFQPDHPDAPTLVYSNEPPKPYREATKAEECETWILDVLEEAAQPLSPKTILTEAREFGFKENAVRRARRNLEGIVVDTASSSRSPNNRWALADWLDEETDDDATL